MSPRPYILPIFFLSGFTGLVYEIIWTRQLSLLFGVSAWAVSAVLTVFMGGLALGSYLAARVVDSRKSPLKVYAILELGIAIYVLFLPVGLTLATPFYLLIHPAIGENFFVISLVRFLFSFLLLIMPSALMGATFPVISRFFVRGEDFIGRDAGTLYTVNTLGAVCGCAATGFYLLENLGAIRSLYLAAGINLMLALAVFLLSRGMEKKEEAREGTEKKQEQEKTGSAGEERAILFLFGLSGFVALALEVFWTRIFVFLMDNTVYAFTTILFTYLTGIAAGSFYFSKRGRIKNARRVFGKMQLGIGLATLFTLFLFLGHDSVAAFWNGLVHKIVGSGPGAHWGGKVLASSLFAFSLLFLPTFLMGGTFPVVFRLCCPDHATAGGSIGRVYAVNTVGAILGSFCAGFLILPLLGTQKGIVLMALFSFSSGMFLLLGGEGKKKPGAAQPWALPFVFLLGGLFYVGDVPRRISEGKLDSGNETLFYKEGIAGTVLVSSQETDRTPRRKPLKRIWINGDPIAGSFRDALQLEWLQAHIPLLLHPDPRETVVVCFGTGSTAGAMAMHPVTEIIAVDTSREVFEAAPYFSEGNGDVVRDKRFRAVIEDGRQFLATTDRRLDFITSEPPPPSNAGIVNLYSREYYEICKARLKPGGMVSQWVPLHHLAGEDFRSLIATFVQVFPHSTLWYTKWDAILVGSDRKITVDFSLLERRMEELSLKDRLGEIGVTDPYRLLGAFVVGEEGLKRYTEGAELVTDDRPTVEFSAPRIHHLGVKIKGENLKALLQYREPVNPLVEVAPGSEKDAFEEKMKKVRASQLLFWEGRILENDDHIAKAVEKFKATLELDPDFPDARRAILKVHIDLAYYFLREGKASAGLRAVKDCMEMDREGEYMPQLLNLRGLLQLSLKEFHAAAADFHRALERDKDFPGPPMNLGALYGQYLNDPKKAARFYKLCLDLKITKEERKMIEEELRKLEKGFYP